MTYEFKLPDLGEGIVEGEIVKWLVKQGDHVVEDQPLVEVMTDKATVTIPSPKRGVVARTHGAEGEIAKVHATLVTLTLEATPGAEPAGPGPAAHPVPPGQPAQPAQAGQSGSTGVAEASGPASAETASGRVLATPVTRRMAREHGIALERVPGTGPSGRVTKVDLERAIAQTANGAPQPEEPHTRPGEEGAVGDVRVPLKGLRRRIAEKMVRSKRSAAHFTFVEEVDATALVSLRARVNRALEAQKDPLRFSYLPFIMKATIAALRRFPALNATFDEANQELVMRGAFHLGMAVATDDGLTVPVIKDAQALSLERLAQEISRLSAAARERRLKVEELSGGTFTITSLGQKGGLLATPIINHPEVGILGVHRIRKRPVVDDADQIVVRHMMYVSLSLDHRVIDGAVGADFTYELIRYLEAPELLLMGR